ncbi:hypothetical protein AwEntero_28590 [Enterobacterales bacterium]|nr:hypothetical protein AwEntero_28590 [Enterobacterales bacterium]
MDFCDESLIRKIDYHKQVLIDKYKIYIKHMLDIIQINAFLSEIISNK